jgi:hypothetical protein
MQVFGVCQLSELKGWRRGSPDNQAAIRRAAVGSWRHRWQKNAVSRSRRPHRLRSKRSPTCRFRSRRSGSTVATSLVRIRASVSGQGGIRPYELPPNRPQIKAPSSAVMDHALRILRLQRTDPLRRSPQSNTQKACNISTTSTDHTVPLPDKLRPATSKNAEPKRPHPSHTYLSRTRD